MTLPVPPRRRWPRYSLRTLFVVVTVFGVSLGWLGVQVKWIRDRHDRMNRARWAFSVPSHHDAPWSIRILGEKGVSAIVKHDGHSSESRRRYHELHQLFPEAELLPHDE